MKEIPLDKRTINTLKEISDRWDWQNLEDHWTILEGAYCRLSWVLDGTKDEEYQDILQDTLDIIVALQPLIKLK